jgi:hypothetical protein
MEVKLPFLDMAVRKHGTQAVLYDPEVHNKFTWHYGSFIFISEVPCCSSISPLVLLHVKLMRDCLTSIKLAKEALTN